jgi:hypothetical protein
MSFKTNFKNKKTIRQELSDIVNDLLYKYENIDKAVTEKLYTVDKDQYHFISRLLKTEPENRTAHNFLSLLFKDIYRTEVLSAKSGQISFLFALYFIKNILKSDLSLDNEKDLHTSFTKILLGFKEKIESIGVPPTENDIKEIISTVCQDDILSEVCWNALQISGLEGKIFIENTKNEQYIVESKDGYSFNLKPYRFFLTDKIWQSKEVKALVVDGFIENVSEIDSIINTAYETKQPMIMIAHGFSEEVVSTLFVNFQKKNINILPVRVRTDVNNINVINDISVVCGMEPVSFLKGQLLSFVKWSELPTIDKVLVTESKTTFENNKTRAAVSNQIRMLMEKRADKHVIDDIQDLLDSRIKNLTANSVVINLPNLSSIKIDEQRVKLDNVLRQVKSVLNYGLVETKILKEKIAPTNTSTTFERIFSNTIKEVLTKTKYPLLSVYLAAAITGKTILMILASSGSVSYDSKTILSL